MLFLTKSFPVFVQQVFLDGFSLYLATVSCHLSGLSCVSRPIPVNLRYIVHNAEKVPLRVDLLLASQGEAIQFHGRGDMRKRRFADRQTHAVDDSAQGRINLALHFVGKGRTVSRLAGKVSHLTDLGLFRISDALCSQRTRDTGGLSSLEPIDFRIEAAAV